MFQQITVLRAHYDEFNLELASKVEEANSKIHQFAKLQNDLQSLVLQRDNLAKTNLFMDRKLSDQSLKLGALEEGKRLDQSEIIKLREQLSMMKREYEFYKDLSEKLELR